MNPLASSAPKTETLLQNHQTVKVNLSRADLIQAALLKREAIATQSGALATWNPSHSTGRIPKDTYIVKDEETAKNVDWNSSACIPMEPAMFDALLSDALETLRQKEELYVLDKAVGHDPASALKVQLITDSALASVFCDTMFCDTKPESPEAFTLIALPYDSLDASKYAGKLREENGQTVPRVVAMDFTRKIGLVYGSQYCGALKKTLFTVMNYMLPEAGILPLHCSANEGPEGSALFLGLSGTGKTTLSNDPSRTLIGDDEHGWNDQGVFNMEGGCYAKLINLSQENEPDIHSAVFTERSLQENGCIIENAMVYPNGTVDVCDLRLGENARASYPLSFLPNTKDIAVTSHPKTIIFLTADASGTLPPVAKLSKTGAMFWFLMGYTSKLAGTELGVTEPKPSFSRFFGEPFMPRHPSVYADLLGHKLDEHDSDVYLINTGWTGGAYGTGKRFPIPFTRGLVNAALDGTLKTLQYRRDKRFKLDVPVEVPGLESTLLNPQNTWEDDAAYEAAADQLATNFRAHFTEKFSGLAPEIRNECP